MSIVSELDKLSNPVRAKNAERYFKTGPGEYGEGDQFIGVTNPILRKICKKYYSLSIRDLRELLASSIHEHRLAAVIIMAETFNRRGPAGQDDLYDLYIKALRNNHINNWDIVDVSAPHVVGEYLLDKPRKPLYDMAHTNHLWTKRVAIISTFAFLRRGQADDTISIAKILLHDNHDLIQKAVGWALREVGKQAGEETLTVFLDSHAKQMPRTMLRYSIERLSQIQRKNYMEH